MKRPARSRDHGKRKEPYSCEARDVDIGSVMKPILKRLDDPFREIERDEAEKSDGNMEAAENRVKNIGKEHTGAY